MNNSLFIFIVCFVSVAYGFSKGSPQYVCLVPYPHHDKSYYTIIPQSNDNLPFQLKLNPDTYQENSTIEIEITSDIVYKGILLSIKPATEDIIHPVGKIMRCNSNDLRFYNFSSEINSCLTHRSNTLKPTKLKCTYEAPPRNYGVLELSALFAKDIDTFWVNVKKEIKYNGFNLQTALPNPCILDLPLIQTSPLYPNDIVTIDDCGTMKSCLLYPLSCYGKRNCQYMVSSKLNGGNVEFELVGPNNGYIAMALSNDTIMRDDLVISCANNPNSGIPSLQTGYTSSGKHKYLVTTVDPNVFNKKAGKSNFLNLENALVCKFQIPRVLVNPVSKLIPKNLSEPLYIFIANGNTYHSTAYVKKHNDPPLISYTSIILYSNENGIYYLRNLEYYKQVHGIIMILSFMILQPIAIIIALHFRHNLSYRVKGRQLWFNIHVLLNLLYFLMSLTGYIYVLCNKEVKFRDAKFHGSFGTIAIGLTFINIIMGFLRPDLTSGKRVYFNWIHFINGITIRIAGYVTFWLVFTTISLRKNLKLLTEVVIILWTVGEFIIGGIFWFLRQRNAKVRGENTRNLAFVYHVNNYGLIAYVCFLFIMSSFLIVGVWIL